MLFLDNQFQENSDTKELFSVTIADRIRDLDEVQSVVNEARSHSDLLTNQVCFIWENLYMHNFLNCDNKICLYIEQKN